MVRPLAWFRPSLRDIRRYLPRAGATVLVHKRGHGPVQAAAADGLAAAPPDVIGRRGDAVS